MSQDPTNPAATLLDYAIASLILLVLFFLIGCAIEWTTTQKIDWFNRDHSRHETNTIPSKAVNKNTK